ncbi:MAG: winged helix-turn-helix transcriptional regulator [Hyphomicrobiales bacterium]|nr:winged helix-turn-helix transcriptional regulator [Hyphomicrobiales bacterium]MBV8441728.1 winged helix-turn-helix transcriptional regulator [Hyphomicrobiales bacterium]
MEANIALPAALIGDPVRAAMLAALCDGRAQPASALAYAARVSPQCASNHLAKLLEGDLLSVEREGRHRYYRLATPQVAAAIEALACMAPAVRSLDVPLTRKGRALRFGRSCYDHLAGQIGVAIAAQCEARNYLASPDHASKRFVVTPAGRRWFADVGIEIEALEPAKGLARRCLDWTERRHHLAGPLGAALLSRFLELGWMYRDGAGRAVGVTAHGRAELARLLDIDVRSLQERASREPSAPVGAFSPCP